MIRLLFYFTITRKHMQLFLFSLQDHLNKTWYTKNIK